MVSIGVLVKAYPNLIAGYISMPKHKRTQVDIVALSSLIQNSFIGIGVILVLACLNLTMDGVSLSISPSGYI